MCTAALCVDTSAERLARLWMLQVTGDKGTPTHITKNGVTVKHRQVQASPTAAEERMSATSDEAASSAVGSKPIPAPRRKADNSVRAAPLVTNNLESDDEIVEIRFEEDSTSSRITQQNESASRSKQQRQQRPAVPKARLGGRHSSGHRSTSSIDLDPKTATIKRSMEELNRREQSEKEITKDLERQLAEIRRLEERQRNILQNTLRQVVHSVSDSQHMTSSPRDENLLTENIDCTSLLSPSFNRKTPLSSPMLAHRSVPSPQSPRKLSSSTRRQDMQTINENGSYSIAELGSMSPASSHRALSNMASPLTMPRQYEPPHNYMGSNSLPVRTADRRAHQTYHDIASSSENLSEKNFRLSTSYSELPPRVEASDRSGYFSDREADRRRIGDDVRAYSDEARRSLLQFEIEKRRKQVEENNQLRGELQRLIQSGSILPEHYDRLRQMYRDHISRSREYLGMSSSSLSSIATSRSRGAYDGYTTDSDIMSSNEHLAGQLSQSSTVERLDQRPKHANYPPKSSSAVSAVPAQAAMQTAAGRAASGTESTSAISSSRAVSSSSRNMQAMPLLEVRAPRSSASSPSGTELVTIGQCHSILEYLFMILELVSEKH